MTTDTVDEAMNDAAVAATSREAAAWDVLRSVLDPEVPALSLVDLGIVRAIRDVGDGLEVVLTPTYSGCPATEVIERSVIDALNAAGLGPVSVRQRRAPAWTTDWISDEGRRKLRDYDQRAKVMKALTKEYFEHNKVKMLDGSEPKLD